MSDLNGDGITDAFEKKHYALFSGRSFFLVVMSILLIVVLAFLDKGESSFNYILGIVAVYCGRSLGQDFANNNRKNGER